MLLRPGLTFTILAMVHHIGVCSAREEVVHVGCWLKIDFEASLRDAIAIQCSVVRVNLLPRPITAQSNGFINDWESLIKYVERHCLGTTGR